jgi:hypothetical protein
MIGVETLIAVAGQLIGLIKARKEYKEDEFSTFVEPLFIETEKVISDYLQLFQNAIESIHSGQDSGKVIFSIWGEIDDRLKNIAILPKIDSQTRKQIAEKYEKDRQNLVHARIKVIELAEVYSNSNLSDDIKDFATSVVNIFNVTTSKVSKLFESRSGKVAEKLKDEVVQDNELLNFLETTVTETRDNWEIASKQYAQLRIKSKRLR